MLLSLLAGILLLAALGSHGSAGLFVQAALAAAGEERPPEILSWRHQVLSHERYAELAMQWQAFVGEHPRDPAAWVHWGHALRYSGENEAARERYIRAFEIDSTDIVALEAYASMKTTEISPEQPAELTLTHARLQRAAREHPNYTRTYYTLFVTSLMRGDEELATNCLRQMVATGDMPRPLFDHGHNMIAGAPQGAIIFTNGDNDTYPPLTAQVVTGERPDVAIVNLSLLNTKWYIRYLRDQGVPITLSDSQIDQLRHAKDNLIGAQMQRHIFDSLARCGWPRPLFYTITVYESSRILPGKLVIEGLGLRIVATDEGPAAEVGDDFVRTRELFDTVYRIDGLRDPLVNWERESALWTLGRNYVTLLEHFGKALIASSPAEAAPYLYRAVAILCFHGDAQWAEHLLEAWQEADPDAPLLRSAQALVERARSGD